MSFSQFQFILLLSLPDISPQFRSKIPQAMQFPASSLIPFLVLPYSLNWTWPCSVESSLLQWRTPLIPATPSTKKLQHRCGQKGPSPADIPWVLKIRHIQPFPLPMQLGRQCSHCSSHIHMYFSTLFHFPFFSNRCF